MNLKKALLSLIAVNSTISAIPAFSQGSINYLSNLGLPSSGSVPVGANGWYAADFSTGTNGGGYSLDSIQLAMTDPSGNPGGFTVTIYTGIDAHGGIFPGTGVAALSGSGNPATSGLYTYVPLSSLTLLPNMEYFVVVSAATDIASGSYSWSVANTGSPGYNTYHWGGEIFFAQSSDGVNWNYTSGTYGQFSLDATPTPEPGGVFLLAMGGLLIGVKHRNEKKRA